MARKAWAPILERAAAIVGEYDTPVTLRQLHYRLVAEAELTGSGYRNNESDYKHLSRLSARARREGMFPPLLDTTRSIAAATTFDSPGDALAALVGWYRRDLLRTQETVPMIVVEKATLVAQLSSWFNALTVPVAALRGYASETFERAILEHVDAIGRPVEVLYCGDFDATGEDIPRAFEDNTGLDLRRVALTPGQVDEYGLPPAMGKTSDSRAAGFVARHGELVQVELEALDPADLRALLETELAGLVDMDLIAVEHGRQEGERAQLRELAETWGETDAR